MSQKHYLSEDTRIKQRKKYWAYGIYFMRYSLEKRISWACYFFTLRYWKGVTYIDDQLFFQASKFEGIPDLTAALLKQEKMKAEIKNGTYLKPLIPIK